MKSEAIFTPLDLQTWERGQIFYYFSKIAPTGYSLSIDLDITHMRRVLKAAELKFFPAYLWLVTRTLNQQKEFKLAERNQVLGYYDGLTPLYAVFHEDDKTFSLMWTEFDENFSVFHHAYMEDKKNFGECRGILAQTGQTPPENAYTVSCVPWISFNHFAVHSYDRKSYYFPSVEAGKFYENSGKIFMPLSVTCHHAAVDGYHVSRFIDTLQEDANSFEKFILS